MDRAPVRRTPRVRAAPLDRRADRTRAARDRRRRVGEADVGRPEPDQRRSPVARQPRRDRHAVVSARARPRDRAGVAVLRTANRRDPAAARRHDPLATADRAGRRAGVSARRADQQDRDRVHQAGRPDRRRGDRSAGSRPARRTRSSSTAGPASWPTCCSASAVSSSAPATSTGCWCRCCAARPASRATTSAARSPAIAPGRRSPPSSTTPRTR